MHNGKLVRTTWDDRGTINNITRPNASFGEKPEDANFAKKKKEERETRTKRARN